MAHHNPLAQFEVYPIVPLEIGGINISFTNASLWMVLATLGTLAMLGIAARRPALIPGRLQSAGEALIDWIAGTMRDTAGEEALKYFPAVFTLFIFILFANFFGMIPYSFTTTSHIIVTFALAICVFLGVTVIAIVKNGPIKFLKLFLPPGVPLAMAPMMFIIELISYLARPISLSLRLAINMMVGHTLMKVIAGFVFVLGLAGIVPLAFLVLLTGFEFGIALLQAYVFTILTCVYLNDALHLH